MAILNSIIRGVWTAHLVQFIIIFWKLIIWKRYIYKKEEVQYRKTILWKCTILIKMEYQIGTIVI